MEKQETGSPEHVEPILAVKDVLETIHYWQNTLGFTNQWTWGEPPNFGGVSWNGVSIEFLQSPDLAVRSVGNAIFIKVRRLESLYKFHQNKNALIVEPLENKPWGMAGYTVKEINGYYVIFAGALLSDRKEKSTELPSATKI